MSRKERYISAPLATLPDLVIPVPIENGGTDGASPLQAADSLGLLSKFRLGQAGGAAKLNSSAMVTREQLGSAIIDRPTLKGPKEVFAEQTVEYLITNFDSLQTYNISVSVGTIVRTGAVLSYTAPVTPGSMTLTLNGRSLVIPIKAVTPIKPEILAPVNGALNQSFNLTFAIGALVLPVGTANHESTDWQISTDAAFTTLVASSNNDTVNKTTWTVNNLARNTLFFVRARVKDVVKGLSEWSNVSEFTTRNSNLPLYETAILRPFSYNNPDGGHVGFGGPIYSHTRITAITPDGSRAVIGDPYIGTSGVTVRGLLYVFRRENGVWVEETRIASPADNPSPGRWPTCVDIDATGTRMVVGTGLNVFVYSRSGTTWTRESKFTAPGDASTVLFGYNVAIDSTGLRVALSCGATRRCYVFLRSGTTWNQETQINLPNLHTQYGSNTDAQTVDFDENANRLIIGVPNYDSAYFEGTGQPAINTGIVHIYSRSGTTWTRDHSWLPPSAYDSYGPTDTTHNQKISNAFFGCGIAMSSDGNKVAVGFTSAGRITGSGPNQPFPVLIYRRDGVTNWVLEAALTSPGVESGVYGVGYQGVQFDMTSNGNGVIMTHYRYENGNYAGPFLSMFEKNGNAWEFSHSVTPSAGHGPLSDTAARISGDGKFALLTVLLSNQPAVHVFA